MNITGDKVILRAVEAQDQAMLQSLVHDPEIVKVTGGYSGIISGMQQMDSRPILSDTDKNGILRCIIADRVHADAGLGIIMLTHVDEKSRTADIYIKLAGPARGSGYGRDAVHTLVSYAFRELGLRQIRSSILEHNTVSRRLFEACGFRQEKMYRGSADREGRCRNVCSYVRKNNNMSDTESSDG